MDNIGGLEGFLLSGPALQQIDSHHAIHEAAHSEAAELTGIFDQAMADNSTDLALQTAYLLIEHWETRTLRHAEAEETGFYKNAVSEFPVLESIVIALTRDHELMRMTVEEIKSLLRVAGPSQAVQTRFHFLVLLERNHSRDEERRLVAGIRAHATMAYEAEKADEVKVLG